MATTTNEIARDLKLRAAEVKAAERELKKKQAVRTKRIVRAANSGMTVREIAKHAGLGSARVGQIVKRGA